MLGSVLLFVFGLTLIVFLKTRLKNISKYVILVQSTVMTPIFDISQNTSTQGVPDVFRARNSYFPN